MINDEREEDRVIITRRRMVVIVRILMMMLMIDQPTARGVSVEMASFDSRCHRWPARDSGAICFRANLPSSYLKVHSVVRLIVNICCRANLPSLLFN